MKLLTILVITTLLVLTISVKENKQKHKFITLDNLDPNQLGSLMKGDWKAMLPDSIKKLMKTEEQPAENETV